MAPPSFLGTIWWAELSLAVSGSGHPQPAALRFLRSRVDLPYWRSDGGRKIRAKSWLPGLRLSGSHGLQFGEIAHLSTARLGFTAWGPASYALCWRASTLASGHV